MSQERSNLREHGAAMVENLTLMKQHSDLIEQFLTTTDLLFVLVLDRELVIKEHNECFKKLLQLRHDCLGEQLLSFLSPPSLDILPLAQHHNQLSTTLLFRAKDASLLRLRCRILKTADDGYLILGGHLMMAPDHILQEMTALTNEMANMARELHRKNRDLVEAQAKIKTLSGIIPICSHCKEIRDDKGYWNQLEKFISEHSEAQFSHAICDKCLKKYYPEMD